jgi:hypothetical protein
MRSRRTVVVLVVVAMALLVSALPSRATFAKQYTLNVAPASVASGGERTFTATYKGKSLFGVGSSDLSVPAAFTGVTLVSFVANKGTATVVGNIVQLRGMSLGLNKTAIVTLKATVPCGPASYTWSAVTKSSSSFSGGADFALTSPSSLTTTATGECAPDSLRFADGFAPQDADTGASLGVIKVEAIRNGAVLTSFTGPVTLQATGGPGTLTGGGPVNAVAGVATFNNPSINAPGTYTIEAKSGTLSTPAPPVTVTISDVVLACPGTGGTSFYQESGIPGDVEINRETSANCAPAPLNVVFDPDQNIVELQKPSLPGSLFTMTIDWTVENAQYPLPATQIDTGTGFHAMLKCVADGGDPDSLPDVPAGEKWCVNTVSATLNSATNTAQVTETYVGTDDPKFKR